MPRCPTRVTERALAVFRTPGRRRVRPAPPPGRPGPLPRGRRARRHHRHRRHRRRPRGARRRRGHAPRRWPPGPAWCAAPTACCPIPSPAAVRLLEGVPTYGRDTRVELTTPTGAALLAALATSFGPMPAMMVARVGLRWRRRRDRRAAQLHPGRDRAAPGRSAAVRSGPGQPALILEANLDDVTGEQLGYAVAAALEGGAFDAWVSPVTMKKGGRATCSTC